MHAYNILNNLAFINVRNIQFYEVVKVMDFKKAMESIKSQETEIRLKGLWFLVDIMQSFFSLLGGQVFKVDPEQFQ